MNRKAEKRSDRTFSGVVADLVVIVDGLPFGIVGTPSVVAVLVPGEPFLRKKRARVPSTGKGALAAADESVGLLEVVAEDLFHFGSGERKNDGAFVGRRSVETGGDAVDAADLGVSKSSG